MDCNKTDLLFMKYMDNTLDENEAKEINLHIKGCNDCKLEFDAYDKLMNEFLNMSKLVEAPEDFESNVMAQIKALSSLHVSPKEKKDNLVYFIWASISAILGIGVVLILFKDSIINFLRTYPSLNFLLQIFVPISTTVSNSMITLFTKAGQLGTFLFNAATLYRYHILIGLIVFGFIYALRNRFITTKNKND